MILPVVMYSYIPNFLTFLRLFAAPILILYLIIDQSFSGKYFGLIIFFFIILTDFFDGYLARKFNTCLLYTSPSPRDRLLSRMPSSA